MQACVIMACMVWSGSFEEGPWERASMCGKRMTTRRKLAKAMLSRRKEEMIYGCFAKERKIIY
jgi:hypothetical protein